MDPRTARQRLAAAPRGQLATIRPDGRPHLVPCCFVLDGDWIYTAVDAKPKSTVALQRLANVRTHPAVCLLVDAYDDEWSDLWWVRVDGQAEVWESGARREVALSALADKYRQYRQTTPPGAVIGIEIGGWRSWP